MKGKKIHNVCTTIFLFLFLLVGIQLALAEDFPPIEEPQMPGRVEGTGTHFEVTDSEYLNIALDSTEEISLTLESVPQIVAMHVESASGATSTVITLSGFPPSTTYYQYEDDYHNLIVITTDGSGSYSYVQDISVPHLVFIQSQPGTWFLEPSAGKIPPIGTWNSVNRTFTLTTDVFETIQIDEDNLTLDGAGHTIDGLGSGFSGVHLSGRTGVTIKNVDVQGFGYFGIHLSNSSGNNLSGNTVPNNRSGIYLRYSSYNNLSGNTSSNSHIGIHLIYSNNNKLTDNIVTDGPDYSHGIYLSNSSYNNLSGNTADRNYYNGIYILSSSGNTTDSNTQNGIFLAHCTSNILTGNTVSNNPNGIVLGKSSNNELTGNAVSNNSTGICFHSESASNNLTSNNASNNSYAGIKFRSDAGNSNTLSDNIANSNTAYGIAIDSSGNTLSGNTANWNGQFGILLGRTSSDNTLESNTASNNSTGIHLYSSNGNTLTANTADSNSSRGINVSGSENILTGNTVSNNPTGLYFSHSGNNTITDNIIEWSMSYGIRFAHDCNENTLTRNTISNSSYGLYFTLSCINNQIYNNNFINDAQAYVAPDCTGNVFNLDKPIGGNYWSDWTSPDDDGDGIVDSPYVFTGGQDNLPWAHQDGWLYPAVAITAPNAGDVVYDRVQIRANVSDVDNDDLSVSFRVDETVVHTTVITNTVTPQEVVYNWDTFPDYDDGVHNITVIADDGEYTMSDSVDVTVRNTVNVAGQIITPVHGQAPDLPIDNVLLELILDGNVAYSVTTDSNGEYQLQDITPNLSGQKYTRRVTKDGEELDVAGGDKNVHYTPGVDVLDEIIKIKNYSAVASCPVDLHFYDVEGNHTGLVDGVIELGIPHSWYSGDVEPEVIVILNPAPVYNIVVEGTGEGTFTLEVSNYITVDGEDVPATIDIQDVPVSLDDEISFTYDYTEIEEEVNALVDEGVPPEDAVQQTVEPPTELAITAPMEPIQVSAAIDVSAGFTDPGVPDTHTATWDWGDGSTSEGAVDEANDSVSGSHPYASAGVYKSR